MNPFSVLASKIYGGLLVASLVGGAFVLASKNAHINRLEGSLEKQATQIVTLRAERDTARANVTTVKAGLAQCNAGVTAAAEQANRLAAQGAKAVAEVQKAGEAALAKTTRRIEALPTNGRTAAEQCAQADAILLGAAQ